LHSIETRLWAAQHRVTAKELWFGSQQRQDVNRFCTVSVLAVGTIPVHGAPEALPTSKVTRLCSIPVTAHSYLVPRLILSGAMLTHHTPYIFMACTGTVLP